VRFHKTCRKLGEKFEVHIQSGLRLFAWTTMGNTAGVEGGAQNNPFITWEGGQGLQNLRRNPGKIARTFMLLMISKRDRPLKTMEFQSCEEKILIFIMRKAWGIEKEYD